MSVRPQPDNLEREDSPALAVAEELPDPPAGLASDLSGRWQIPLLVVAMVGLGAAVWRIRPAPKPLPPTFDELFARAEGLKEASLYEEAGKYAESLLLDPTRTAEQQARLHRLMADVIYAHESGNSIHGPNNCRSLLYHSDRMLLDGESYTAQEHNVRAQAREWLGQLSEAVAEYRQAVDKGVEGPWNVRQHILQLRRLTNELNTQQLHAELDTFLASEEVPLDLQFWAAEKKIDLYSKDKQHELANRFLETNLKRFENSAWRLEYDFLRALSWFYTGRSDDAERLLRSLRDQLVPGDPLYAQTGWLLGSVLQQNQAPEYALSMFDDVLQNTVPSPSRAASLLGRAECLAEMERYDESLQAYHNLIRIAAEDPVTSEIDLKGVRESARVWCDTLYMLGRLEQALGYLKLAAGLVPPIDHAAQATYSRRLADLQFELGRAASSRAAARTGNAKADGEAARKYLAEAGEEYLRLAKLSTLDPSATTSAVWQAAESFDLAGERARMIEVLETFVREYTDDMRVPEALLQLGRARQAAGQIPKAIAAYQRNLTEFPRTPAALGSLIPLSDCFRQTGATDKAEQILLRVVTPRPGDDLALITPEAPEYQDALFRLGDLYVEAEQYEKAISRYEEALDRYGKDPRADLATYRLADCYRRSAAQIRRDVARPENVAYKDGLLAMHQKRLQRANQLYQAFIDRYEKRSDASLSDLERMSVKLSHLYCADCVYDLSLVSGMQDTEPFARSLSMYEKAAWTYQREPIAMSAYVQIMNCYLHMGKVPQAWMALQRARWALRNIPDEEFAKFSPGQDRAYWDNYLGWLEKKPTFASVALAKAG